MNNKFNKLLNYNNLLRVLPYILIVTGLSAIIIAVLIEFLNINSKPGFGAKQIYLVFIGLCILLGGIVKIISIDNRGNRGASNRSVLFKAIIILGGVNLICFSLYTSLSYILAPSASFDLLRPNRTKLTSWIYESFGLIGKRLVLYINGNNVFLNRQMWIFAYCFPVIISTVIFLISLFLIYRNRAILHSNLPKYLYRFAVIFAIVTALACPVLVPDFWYPLVWGTMVDLGINPYYTELLSVPDILKDIPLVGTHEKMMYGPLWAILNGAIMSIAGQPTVLSALLFKILLLSAWLGSLKIISILIMDKPIWNQSISLLVFGWLPAGLIQALGDGHNDIIMIFFVFLWIYFLHKNQRKIGNIFLIFSVLIKYITAPLFLLDLLDFVWMGKKKIRNYFSFIFIPIIISLATIGFFYRSPEFFEYLTSASTWHFFTIREAVNAMEILLIGRSLPYLGEVLRLTFVLVPLAALINYYKNPVRENFWKLVLALISTLLFGLAGHIWPWYLVWVLGLAALVPESSLSRWIIGFALGSPFLIIIWVVFPEINSFYIFDLPALMFFSFAFIWFFLVPKEWFPKDESLLKISSPQGVFNKSFNLFSSDK